MLTSSYYVDSVDEAIHLVLDLELSFKWILISKAREHCSKCEGYGHYNYQCPQRAIHVNIVYSDDVDDSMVVEDVYVSSEITSVVEDILVDSSAPILNEVHFFLRAL